MKKYGLLLVASFAGAMEFGYMGNNSFGLGGSGVALADSPFNIYYNPALIAASNNIAIGYSAGIRIKQRELVGIADKINKNNPTNASNIINQLKNSNNLLAMTSENGITAQIPLSIGETLTHSLGLGAFYIKKNTIKFNITTSSGSSGDIYSNWLDLVEVPLSYSMRIFSGFGNFYIGANFKYIYANHSFENTKLNNSNVADSFKDSFAFGKAGISSSAFGLDIGAAYSIFDNALVLGSWLKM